MTLKVYSLGREGSKLKVMLELIASRVNMEVSLMDPPGSMAETCLISRGQGWKCLTSPHGRAQYKGYLQAKRDARTAPRHFLQA